MRCSFLVWSNDRLDGCPSSEEALDGLGQAALHAGDIDLEVAVLWGVVPEIAGIGDDLVEGSPQLCSIWGITVARVWPS